MKKLSFSILSLLIIILSILTIQPITATPGPAAGNCQLYWHQANIQVAAVVSTGDNELWSDTPGCGIAHSATQAMKWHAQFSGPVFLGAGSTTWAANTFTGCTMATINIAGGILTAFTASDASADVTMTSTECHGSVTFQATILTGTAYQWTVHIPINIRVEQPNEMFLCAAPETTINSFNPATQTCQEPQINNFNFVCAAPLIVPDNFNEATTTCNTLQLLNFNCGASGLTSSNQVQSTACLIPQIDNINRLCDASNYGATCNRVVLAQLDYLCAQSGTALTTFSITANICVAPTFNVVNSGTSSIAITSWPQLQNIMCGATTSPNTGLCTTPTFNIQNAAGQTFAISGTLSTVLSGTTNNVLSGTINVVNSGGQTIAISSWPTLNAVLSGTVTIPSQCTSSAHCFMTLDGNIATTDTLTGTINTVVSGNLNTHQDQACGAVVHCQVDMTCLGGTCQSMVGNATVINNGTTSNSIVLKFLPYNLLLIAVAFFAIIAEAKTDLLYWIMCLILSIILLVVRPSGSIIPPEFFIGWLFVVLYQAYVVLKNNRGLLNPQEE